MMRIRTPNEEYIKAAEALTDDQKDRLLCRMRGKLSRKLEDEKLEPTVALALQLEIEDIELAEWREKMSVIKEKEKY